MKKLLSSLLLPLFASLSLSLAAAPAPTSGQSSSTGAAVEGAALNQGKVNLNLATAEMLQEQLSGIGKTKAQAIVAYRDAHGNFVSLDELLEVKGIGSSLLDRNRDRLTLD